MDMADFDALEAAARGRLASGAYMFAACAAGDEITAAENGAAWRRLRLRPRVLRDVPAVDVATRILGAPASMPLMLAPTGRHRLYHPEGEAATARAAAAAGIPFVLATNSTVSIEDVAAERRAAPQWFQLYMTPDRLVTEQLLDRLAQAGFGALVLTVDQPVPGYSPRAARDPAPVSEAIRHVNLPGQPVARTAYDPAIQGAAAAGGIAFPTSLTDLEWLVRRAPMPVLVKGVLRGDDARRAVEAGARGIIVSNHGGRHLDTTVTTAEALPEIAASVGDTAEIYVDGGIRRGTDIVKALALGARAVLIGRPMLWGLATGGSDGVAAVLDYYRAELVRTMALCGLAAVAEAAADLVAGPHGGPPSAQM